MRILDRIKTGNAIYDTIIAIALLSCQDTIADFIKNLRIMVLQSPTQIYKLVMWLWLLRKKQEHCVTKTASVKYITESREINTLFEPIMWYINTLTDKNKIDNVSLQTTKTNNTVMQQVPQERESDITFLDYTIKYTIRKELVTIYADREQKRENIIIDMIANVPEHRSGDIFQQFSETAQKKWVEFNRKKTWVQNIYRNNKDTWTGKPNKTSRKLETVILKNDQTQEIAQDVQEFLEREDWYMSRDVPYTRRYMFWGSPGTGKSSCIKALATYSKRHIYYLVLSEVDSDSTLFKLFEAINFYQSILVIEDIDCASKITHLRNEEKKDDEEEESKLTLSGLLNAIDGGMIDNHGQIMIITTNHPDMLDPALIRPGRVDRKFEFGNCNDEQIRGLYYNFFDEYPPFEHEFPVDKYSPAEITSLLLQYKKDPVQAWDTLVAKMI